MPFRSEKQRKYLWAKHPEIARKWTNKYGSKIKRKGGFKRVVDNKMRGAYGETDTDNKIIRINKVRHHKKVKRYNKNKDGSEKLIDTIVHEEFHAKHPKAHEKTVYKKAKQLVKTMGSEQKKKLYNHYNFKAAEKRLGVKY